jgi:dolichol-phosphate mannosyltransferase
VKLSVVIPARNEEGCIVSTLDDVITALEEARVDYELVVVDDRSTDATVTLVTAHFDTNPRVRVVRNTGRSGFGMAVRTGLHASTGDAIAVMMADASDSPKDLVRYYELIQQGYDCAFGSRFMKDSRIIDYPPHKLVINRIANLFIRLLFGFRYNDITNAFKCYSRPALLAMEPLISPHFNLTVEMPLKAIVRGYSYAVIPISWTNRKTGVSKLKIKEMGSRYLFIVLYLWLEKYLSRGDYHRATAEAAHHEQTATRHA